MKKIIDITVTDAKIISKELQSFGEGANKRTFMKIDIGSNTSFSLHPADPLVKKLAIGRVVDLKAGGQMERTSINDEKKTAATYITLQDVEITDIRASQAEDKFKDLSDDEHVYEERHIQRKEQSPAPTPDVKAGGEPEISDAPE